VHCIHFTITNFVFCLCLELSTFLNGIAVAWLAHGKI
jgi:hypothetical protein